MEENLCVWVISSRPSPGTDHNKILWDSRKQIDVRKVGDPIPNLAGKFRLTAHNPGFSNAL